MQISKDILTKGEVNARVGDDTEHTRGNGGGVKYLDFMVLEATARYLPARWSG